MLVHEGSWTLSKCSDRLVGTGLAGVGDLPPASFGVIIFVSGSLAYTTSIKIYAHSLGTQGGLYRA